MVSLRVLLTPLLDAAPTGTRRTASALTRELVRTAPRGCAVEGILPRVDGDVEAAVRAEVPGLSRMYLAARRQESLDRNWLRGLGATALGGGFLHATTLHAPMVDLSDTVGQDQTVVTIEDATFLTNPELLPPEVVKAERTLLKRAHRYATGIVTPTNAVAETVLEAFPFGDRLRVIGGAHTPSIRLPGVDDVNPELAGDAVAQRLGLPSDYLLTLASPALRHGLEHALRAIARPELTGLRLVVVGARADAVTGRTFDSLMAETGCPTDRVVHIGPVSDESLAVVYQRATALLVPSISAGFGLPIVEAFAFGTPVIHSDHPALVEVGMDATITVERGNLAEFGTRLAYAAAMVASDSAIERQLRVAGGDQHIVHSWSHSAQAVWTMHADL